MNIRTGIERTGCDCRVFQVSETLPNDVLLKMNGPSTTNEVPVISVDQLAEADGFLFGMPTRFGTIPTQMKNLFDACDRHWLSDALVGKPVGHCQSILFTVDSTGLADELSRQASSLQRQDSLVDKKRRLSPVYLVSRIWE
jgi:multimeric flavodoxin WrbA